ncbi:MAG: hypothetical protein AAB892_00485, partial [Patescibacteria group bacterium]
MGVEVDEAGGHWVQDSKFKYCYDSSMKWVLGVDEAGRGPLAGPVSVGIIAVAEGYDILAAFPGLNDSKKLS